MAIAPQDRLHPSGSDPWWFEAYAFGFHVPERRLSAYVYPWFRPNRALAGGGVIVWDDSGSTSWTVLHHDYAWSLPMPREEEMYQDNIIVTPQGVRIICEEKTNHYRITYETAELALNVSFTPIGPPGKTESAVETEDVFKGHVDQPGHYTGWIRLGDEQLEVDCYCIRDRSWGPRRDDMRDMHIGYYHATCADRAFLFMGVGNREGDKFSLISGYLNLNGEQHPLANGNAVVTRDHQLAPQSCMITATDAAGRPLDATCDGLSPIMLTQQPGMCCWSTLSRWQMNGAELWGEMQDAWHPDKFRAFHAERHAEGRI